MDNKECIVVNFIGGPGCGKTIITNELFCKLKRAYITCDIVPEYFKKKLREKAEKVIQNQIYIFGKQQFHLFSMKDDVEVIITDSPILLPAFYDKTKCPHLAELSIKEYNSYNNLLYFIERDESIAYETEGRYQDFNEAKQVDADLQDFLWHHAIDYKVIKGIGEDSLNEVLSDIKKLLNK